jgi:hypothetical protein
MVFGFELILAKQAFYHLSHPPALFALFFQVGSHIFALTGLDGNHPIYASM